MQRAPKSEDTAHWSLSLASWTTWMHYASHIVSSRRPPPLQCKYAYILPSSTEKFQPFLSFTFFPSNCHAFFSQPSSCLFALCLHYYSNIMQNFWQWMNWKKTHDIKINGIITNNLSFEEDGVLPGICRKWIRLKTVIDKINRKSMECGWKIMMIKHKWW